MKSIEDWIVEPVGENLNLLSGYPFDSKYFSTEEGFPLLRIRDIVDSKVETYYTGFIPPGFIIANGDVLVGMDGDFHIAKWQERDALLNQRVLKVREGLNN